MASSTNSGTTPTSSDSPAFTTEAIRNNLHTRVSYLVSFIGFTSADTEALQAVAPHIRPYLPTVAEAMYNKMWSFDVTRQSLTKPNNPHIPKNADLAQARERMRYMTSFQGHWLLKIFIADWEDLSTFAYWDRVGISHIGESAFRHRGERGAYQVDYVHIGALLGHITDLMVSHILQLEQITLEEKTRAVSALTKAMWIQNDLISRHYVMPVETINPPQPERGARGVAVDINAEPKGCPFSSMYSSGSTSATVVPPNHPPSRYGDEGYVEEPWPESSDEEDEGPNPWSNDAGAYEDNEQSDSDYGETSPTMRKGRVSKDEESETAAESSSVGSISTSEGIAKTKTAKMPTATVDPKVVDAVTGRFKDVDLQS